MVALASTARAAAAASEKMPSAPPPSGPSRSSTISSTVTSPGGRPNEYPPFTPRWDFSTPARRSTANSCSRNCTGMSRRRASSPIGTGAASPSLASSTSARTAYGDFVVIDSTPSILGAQGDHPRQGARGAATLQPAADVPDGPSVVTAHWRGRGGKRLRQRACRPAQTCISTLSGAHIHVRAHYVESNVRLDAPGAPRLTLREEPLPYPAAVERPPALEPAALGGVQHGLGAVDRAELAVDVVQVRAHRAGGERELVRDLFVDEALGEALQHFELAVGERARLDRARALRGRVWKVVEHRAQLGRAEADRAGGAQQLDARHRQALRVVGEHVGEADEGGVAGGVVGVVALDRGRDRLGQVPAPGQHAADQRVVDAELAALVVQPLLGRPGRAVDLLRITRVGVHEHELANVVEQRGDQQAVAVRVAGLRGEAVGGALHGDRVEAEALG